MTFLGMVYSGDPFWKGLSLCDQPNNVWGEKGYLDVLFGSDRKRLVSGL